MVLSYQWGESLFNVLINESSQTLNIIAFMSSLPWVSHELSPCEKNGEVPMQMNYGLLHTENPYKGKTGMYHPVIVRSG